MHLLALLLALGAQHVTPPPRGWPDVAYGRLALWLARQLDAGDRRTGALALAALLAVTCVPALLLGWLASAIHPVALLAVNSAALFLSLRFFPTTAAVAAIERALRSGDAGLAQRELARWRDEAQSGGSRDTVVPRAALRALREAHHGTFAMLFWFAILPGPLGLVLHPVLRRAAELWGPVEGQQSSAFGSLAQQAFHWVDWLPQRATALTFAVVGNFEDALYSWRTQAVPGQPARDAVILAAGAGALGIPFSEAAPSAVEPPLLLGSGETASEDVLGSLGGLLWRALVLWVIAYAVLAAVAG